MKNCKDETISYSNMHSLFDLLRCKTSILQNYVTLVTLVWSIIFSVSNQPDFNWNSKNIKVRLTSENHTHCILKILFHVTHSKYYLGNIWISGIFRKYVPLLSWTFFANIKFMNYTFL